MLTPTHWTAFIGLLLGFYKLGLQAPPQPRLPAIPKAIPSTAPVP